MNPSPSSEWYETMIRVKPGVRILGLISMDNHEPREFYARMFVLDESDYGDKGALFHLSREKRKNGLTQLRKVKGWSDFASSDYFDFALTNRFSYANNSDHGSPTIKSAYALLIPAMKMLARELK